MAASYHTGTAANPTDLLQGIVTWLITQGWTQDMSQADGDGWRAHLHKSGVYVNLRATANTVIFPSLGAVAAPGIGLYLGTGYDAGQAWNLQPGRPQGYGQSYTVGSFMRLPSGAILGWRGFDDGADNIVVVVERTGGIFTHLGFGLSVEKVGTWTGGPYFFAALGARYGGWDGMAGDAASNAACPFGVVQREDYGIYSSYGYAGYVRADVDSHTGGWVGFSNDTASAQEGYPGVAGGSGIDLFPGAGGSYDWSFPTYTGLSSVLVSDMNEQAVLLPVHLYAKRDSGGYSLIGSLRHVYDCGAVGHGFLAAATYTIGPKTFMLFPHFAVLKAA
jgi:hypothetical protein